MRSISPRNLVRFIVVWAALLAVGGSSRSWAVEPEAMETPPPKVSFGVRSSDGPAETASSMGGMVPAAVLPNTAFPAAPAAPAAPATQPLSPWDMPAGSSSITAVAADSAAIQQRRAETEHRLGIIALGEGDSARALRHFLAAAQMAPPSVELLNDLGTVQYMLNQFAKAEATFGEALRLDPNNPTVIGNLAVVVGLQQRFQESFDLFARAKGPAEARVHLQRVLARCGQPAAAVDRYAHSLAQAAPAVPRSAIAEAPATPSPALAADLPVILPPLPAPDAHRESTPSPELRLPTDVPEAAPRLVEPARPRIASAGNPDSASPRASDAATPDEQTNRLTTPSDPLATMDVPWAATRYRPTQDANEGGPALSGGKRSIIQFDAPPAAWLPDQASPQTARAAGSPPAGQTPAEKVPTPARGKATPAPGAPLAKMATEGPPANTAGQLAGEPVQPTQKNSTEPSADGPPGNAPLELGAGPSAEPSRHPFESLRGASPALLGSRTTSAPPGEPVRPPAEVEPPVPAPESPADTERSVAASSRTAKPPSVVPPALARVRISAPSVASEARAAGAAGKATAATDGNPLSREPLRVAMVVADEPNAEPSTANLRISPPTAVAAGAGRTATSGGGSSALPAGGDAAGLASASLPSAKLRQPDTVMAHSHALAIPQPLPAAAYAASRQVTPDDAPTAPVVDGRSDSGVQLVILGPSEPARDPTLARVTAIAAPSAPNAAAVPTTEQGAAGRIEGDKPGNATVPGANPTMPKSALAADLRGKASADERDPPGLSYVADSAAKPVSHPTDRVAAGTPRPAPPATLPGESDDAGFSYVASEPSGENSVLR